MNLKGMNVKKLQYIKEFLIEQMNHWLFFPIPLIICSYARQDFNAFLVVLMWILCSLLPLTFFLLRMKAKSFVSFLLLQLAAVLSVAAAMSVMLSNEYMLRLGRVVCIGCAICYMFHSTLPYLKNKETFTKPMPLSVGVAISAVGFGVLLALGAETSLGFKAAFWVNYYIFPLIISIGLFFVIIYIQRYIDFLNVNKSSAGYLPAAEMFHSGFGLVIGYTVFGIAVMIMLANGSWLGKLSSFLVNIFTNILKWIAAKLIGSPSASEIQDNPDFGKMPDQFPDFKINKPFWLWTVLEYGVIFLLLVALLVLLVRFLMKAIKFFCKIALYRMVRSEADDEEAFDIREKCDIVDKPDKKKQRYFGPLSYGDRIRRLYKRKLISSTGRMTPGESKMLGVYTAREWEQKLATQGMASVYEQARYSGQEMTAEDVKRMKDACR